jgi:hypothetical protein
MTAERSDDWALSRDGDSFKGLGSWEGSQLLLMNECIFLIANLPSLFLLRSSIATLVKVSGEACRSYHVTS